MERFGSVRDFLKLEKSPTIFADPREPFGKFMWISQISEKNRVDKDFEKALLAA